jgi:hypothetical protein
MATLKEFNFTRAAQTAESVRQAAYAAAFLAYAPNGFGVFANLATYQAALVTADNAFYDAVQSAATTNGISMSANACLSPAVPYGASPSASILT